MLNRKQSITVLMLHNQLWQNPLGELPRELVQQILQCNEPENTEAALLLHHVAYGEEAEAKTMLEINPRLLFQVSNVITPSGLEVIGVTPYECALGAGDPMMAAMMLPYFSSIPDGEKEKNEQYEKYRLHIEAIPTKQPQDLQWLMDIIKQSSAADVTAALDKNMEHESPLRDALIQFRKEVTPGKLLQPGMHFNYQDLVHAYAIYHKEIANPLNALNDDQCTLFSCQVLGYLMRNLPAHDRQIFAHSLYNVIKHKGKPARTFEFRQDKGKFFPITAGDSSLSGLGFDYYVSVGLLGTRHDKLGDPQYSERLLKNLCNAKKSGFQQLHKPVNAIKGWRA